MYLQKLWVNKFLPNMLLLVLFLAQTPDSWAAVLIYQHTGTEYSISVFKSEAPALYTEHNISLSSITGDQAIFIYNGNSYTVTCNGTWHNLNAAPDPKIQNMISCLPDTETFLFTGSKIDASIRLFDQNLYNSSNIHLMAPEYNDPFLAGTSEAAPYCLDDTYYNASACKWEVQNISHPLLASVPKGSWIVYARTDSDLPFTIEADPVYPYAIGDIVCAADLTDDNNITSNEIDYCQEGLDENEYLCPIELMNCEWSVTQPECIGNGVFIGGNIDMCEDSPNCDQMPGYSLHNGLCRGTPMCMEPGSMHYSSDMCEHSCSCSPGFRFSAAGDVCFRSAFCTHNGRLNTSIDRCVLSANEGICASGYTYNSDDDICRRSPACSNGSSYNTDSNRCERNPLCPPGYSYNADANRCRRSPGCAHGSYNIETNRCEAEPLCPNGYVFNEDRAQCQREPFCICGIDFVPDTDMCEGFTCPHGCEYGCIQNKDNIFQCSPYNCFNFDPDRFHSHDTVEGENDKKDDGVVKDGTCLGTLYIFSGNDKRCRMSGIETSFNDCCKNQADMYLIDLEVCNGNEMQLTVMKEKKLCHYVGDYCSKAVPLIGCIQKKETYCCFHSMLSRIINEQGRTQLQNFGGDGGWGSPKAPNCRGFTTDEFQMLNFSLIDLSEWYSDITTKPVGEVQDSMKEKMDRFYE